MFDYLIKLKFFNIIIIIIIISISLICIVANSSLNTIESSIRCDIFDISCHQLLQQHQLHTSHPQQNRLSKKNCDNFQKIWLIPGQIDTSCTRPDSKRLIEVETRFMTIKPQILEFPGCFEIEIKNIRLNDDDNLLKSGLFAKTEYQWLNVKDFGDFRCQNTSSNGCGGFGNNCYYCNICENLHQIDRMPTTLAEQFRGLKCPTKPGFYTFRKEFCFNDWSTLDLNGDCHIDFLEADGGSDLKAALSSLQQVGYGTIVAKIHLSHNATDDVVQKKALKEKQIDNLVARELRDQRHSATQKISDFQVQDFYKWYSDYRKNLWHREEYLPWLLYENEILCLRLTFNICERRPINRREQNVLRIGTATSPFVCG